MTSISRGNWGQGEECDEEVKGGSAWRCGVRWGEGHRQQRRVEADPTEDVATDSDATGGGDQGNGVRRRGGIAAVCHGGVARGCGGIAK